MQLKSLFLLSSLFVFASCDEGFKKFFGADLKDPHLKRKKFDVLYPKPLLVNREVKQEIRDATFLIYANPQDFNTFVYLPNPKEWFDLFKFLDYKMPYLGIQADLENIEKAERLVLEIQSIGQARDDAFLVTQSVALDIAGMDREKLSLIKTLKKDFTRYKCFPLISDKKKCKLKKDLETINNVKTYKVKGSCLRIKQAVQRIVDLSITANPAEFAKFNKGIDQCQQIKKLSDLIEPLEQKAAPYGLVRSQGKQFVTDILEKLQTDTGALHLAIISSLLEEQEAERDESPIPPRSQIQFNKAKTAFNIFKLFIDFGTDGYREYSLANGKVEQLNIVEIKPGIFELSFVLHAPEHRTEASLTLNFHDPDLSRLPLSEVHQTTQKNIFGVRMIGTTENFYLDGTMRHGVVKIELDYL